MNHTFSILFYLKTSKIKDDGTIPIYIRVTVDGMRSEISSKRYVLLEKWNKEKGRVKGTNENSREINYNLDQYENKLHRIYADLLSNNKLISSKIIKNEYLGVKEKKKTLIEVFRAHNNKIEKLIGKRYEKSTLIKYNTSLKHLLSFLKYKYRRDDILLSELDHSFIAEFHYFLLNEKLNSINTANKYALHLKTIVKGCVDFGFIVKNPFSKFKLKDTEVNKVFLVEDEINRLRYTIIKNNRLSEVRDVFVFCCFTGLSYSDVKSLTSSDIEKGIHSDWIIKNRKKTKVRCRIPLYDEELEIIDKYKNHPECIYNKTLLPVLSNQKMNKYLKEIAVICGIKKKLSMHTARHTCATYSLTQGVSISSVSDLLGHKSLRTTQIYAKVTNEKMLNEFNSIRLRTPELSKQVV